ARPEGVVTAIVDPTTGELATDACPWTATEVFVARFAPRELCSRHSGWFANPLAPEDGVRPRERRRQGGLRGWLDRVFGEGEEEPADEEGGYEDEGRPEELQTGEQPI